MRLAPVPISIRLKVSSLIINLAVTQRTYKNVRKRSKKHNSFFLSFFSRLGVIELAVAD
jgi:hypothetical protein